MTNNVGLRGAREIASKELASVSDVKISGSSDIVMGNVTPLKKRIKELEAEIKWLKDADKRGKT